MYSAVIMDGLAKLQKYYSWFDEKPGYVLALGQFPFSSSILYLTLVWPAQFYILTIN